MNNIYDELDLLHLVKACFYKIHYFLIGGVIAVAAVAGFYLYTVEMNPTYSSEMTVYFASVLKSTPDNQIFPLDKNYSLDQVAQYTSTAEAFIPILRNRTMFTNIFESLNINIETLDLFLAKNLEVNTIALSPFLRVKVKGADPVQCRDICDRMIEFLPGTLEQMNIDGTVSVVEYPEQMTNPQAPGKLLLLIIVGITGMVGFFCILFDELLYQTMRSEKDIKRVTGHSLIAALPDQKHLTKAAAKIEAVVNDNLDAIVGSMAESKSLLSIFLTVEQDPQQEVFIAAIKKAAKKQEFPVLTISLQQLAKEGMASLAKKAEEMQVQHIICSGNLKGNQLQITKLLKEDCDVVLMAHHNKTTQKAFQYLASRIEQLDRKILGTVYYDVKARGLFHYYSQLTFSK